MFADYVGQNFGQGNPGMSLIYHVWGLSWKARGWNYLKAHSLTCQLVIASGLLGTSVSLHVVFLPGLVWTPNMTAGSQGRESHRVREPGRSCTHFMAQPWKSHRIHSAMFCWLVHHKPPPTFQRWGHRPPTLSAKCYSHCKRSIWDAHIVWKIYIGAVLGKSATSRITMANCCTLTICKYCPIPSPVNSPNIRMSYIQFLFSFQIRKLRPNGIKRLAQGCITSKWYSQHLSVASSGAGWQAQ